MSTVSSATFFTTLHCHAQQRAWPTRHWKDGFHTSVAHWLSEGRWRFEGHWYTQVTNGLLFMLLNTQGLRKIIQPFSYSLTQMCKLNNWDPKSLQCPPSPAPWILPLIPSLVLTLTVTHATAYQWAKGSLFLLVCSGCVSEATTWKWEHTSLR